METTKVVLDNMRKSLVILGYSLSIHYHPLLSLFFSVCQKTMASWNAGRNKCHQPCLRNGSRVLMLGVCRGECLSLENSHSCNGEEQVENGRFFFFCSMW